MIETSVHPGREYKQVKNFAKGALEVRQAPKMENHLTKAALIAYMTMIPDHIRRTDILHNANRLRTADRTGVYLTRFNDRLDYEGANRTDLTKSVAESQGREKVAKESLLSTLRTLSVEERVPIEQNITNATEEVEYVEKWIREKRDSGTITFVDVDRYRAAVNAIDNVLISSILFGPPHLASRLQIIAPEQMDMQTIEDKYGWILGSKPTTPMEQSVAALHNVAMAGQVLDDWKGYHIDRLLNIPTYASAALKMADGDTLAAKRIILDKKDDFKRKARELGLGFIPTKGAVTATGVMERALAILTKRGKKHDVIKKRVERHIPHLREVDYVRGTLDVPNE